MARDLKNWRPCPRPEREAMEGAHVRLEPLDRARHGDGLYKTSAVADADRRFAWLYEDPPGDQASFLRWVDDAAATEALFLFAAYVFDELGYRRFEWKCNNDNEPSKRSALRFGFTFEGLFRQHMVVKGANRDTAWFAMIDAEWPALRQAYRAWLERANFDAAGNQKRRLEDFRRELP